MLTVRIGLLCVVLDICVLVHSKDLYSEHRRDRSSAQSSLCDIVLPGRHHSCPIRLDVGIHHDSLCAICEGCEQRMDQILLVRGGTPAHFPDICLVHCCIMGIPPVCIVFRRLQKHSDLSDREWPWVQSGFLTLHSLVRVSAMHLALLSLIHKILCRC